jgi:hypothetical protein
MEKAMLPIYAQDRMPYVLKEGGPVRTLAVRIGGILTELWEYKKGDAAPYARLIKENREPAKKMNIAQEAPFQATLSPMEALVVADAIKEWKGLLAAGTKGSKTQCAAIQVDRLTIKLYNPARGQSPYAAFSFGADATTQSMILSRTEATLVAGTIGLIAPGETQHG